MVMTAVMIEKRIINRIEELKIKREAYLASMPRGDVYRKRMENLRVPSMFNLKGGLGIKSKIKKENLSEEEKLASAAEQLEVFAKKQEALYAQFQRGPALRAKISRLNPTESSALGHLYPRDIDALVTRPPEELQALEAFLDDHQFDETTPYLPSVLKLVAEGKSLKDAEDCLDQILEFNEDDLPSCLEINEIKQLLLARHFNQTTAVMSEILVGNDFLLAFKTVVLRHKNLSEFMGILRFIKDNNSPEDTFGHLTEADIITLLTTESNLTFSAYAERGPGWNNHPTQFMVTLAQILCKNLEVDKHIDDMNPAEGEPGHLSAANISTLLSQACFERTYEIIKDNMPNQYKLSQLRDVVLEHTQDVELLAQVLRENNSEEGTLTHFSDEEIERLVSSEHRDDARDLVVDMLKMSGKKDKNLRQLKTMLNPHIKELLASIDKLSGAKYLAYFDDELINKLCATPEQARVASGLIRSADALTDELKEQLETLIQNPTTAKLLAAIEMHEQRDDKFSTYLNNHELKPIFWYLLESDGDELSVPQEQLKDMLLGAQGETYQMLIAHLYSHLLPSSISKEATQHTTEQLASDGILDALQTYPHDKLQTLMRELIKLDRDMDQDSVLYAYQWYIKNPSKLEELQTLNSSLMSIDNTFKVYLEGGASKRNHDLHNTLTRMQSEAKASLFGLTADLSQDEVSEYCNKADALVLMFDAVHAVFDVYINDPENQAEVLQTELKQAKTKAEHRLIKHADDPEKAMDKVVKGIERDLKHKPDLGWRIFKDFMKIVWLVPILHILWRKSKGKAALTSRTEKAGAKVADQLSEDFKLKKEQFKNLKPGDQLENFDPNSKPNPSGR